MNLNKLPCVNTIHLNKYLAEQEREYGYEDAIASYAAEIAADLMSVGRCNVEIHGRTVDVDWSDFLLAVDEAGAWDRLNDDKDDLFADFCNDFAGHRAAFMEEE